MVSCTFEDFDLSATSEGWYVQWESVPPGQESESRSLGCMRVLASDYCFGAEVEMAMQRMKNQGAKVVPVLLRPCLWKESRFKRTAASAP